MANSFDYLFLSTRVKSLETLLLTQQRRERMLEADSHEAALEVLLECGYEPVSHPSELEKGMERQRQAMLADLGALAPDPVIVDVFRLRYDYHNAKVLLKSQHRGLDPQRLLLPGGRIPLAELEEAVRSGVMDLLPMALREGIQAAREILSTSGDPQRSDFLLDRAYYGEMGALAEKSGSAFLQGYVALSIDAANLRALVRTRRMGKGQAFLEGALVPGGTLASGRILAAAEGSWEDLYRGTALDAAAEEARQLLSGGSMTRFEKLCDDALTAYLSKAKYIAFGDAPLIAYLAAKENEWTSVRVIMGGRMAALPPETIRERLREAYV